MDVLLRAALDAIGGVQAYRRIPNINGLDRGTGTYRVDGWKIKTMPLPAVRLRHEAGVYELRERQGLHSGSRHGHMAEGTWLAVPWLPGRTLWEAFASARLPNSVSAPYGPLLRTALDACAELRRWQHDGWLHGDVQPSNIIVAERATFIDFEYARHPFLALPFPYRGGIAETTAPEVARELVRGPGSADGVRPAAEIYALGASIRWAWTGHPPTGVRRPGDDRGLELVGGIADGRRRSLRDDRPYTFPALEDLIEAATSSGSGSAGVAVIG